MTGRSYIYSAILVLVLLLAGLVAWSVSSKGKPTMAYQGAAVQGTEHLQWDQAAASYTEIRQLQFKVSVDGGEPVPLPDADCKLGVGPGRFVCSAHLPPLSSGTHTLQVVAVDTRPGGTESPKSESVLVNVSSSSAQSQPLTAGAPTRITANEGTRVSVEVFARTLDGPTSLVFAPDRRAFVLERHARIRVITNGDPQASPAMEMADAVDRGESGELIDLALHPDFGRNHFAYVLYAAASTGARATYRVARFREVNGRFGERAVVVDGIPVDAQAESATIGFGPDRRMYLGVPDLAQSKAQDLASSNGKVLRLADDGRVPADNPRSSPVFSSGLGAPTGLAWDPRSGELWVTDRGGSNTSLHRILASADYGWPDDRLRTRGTQTIPLMSGASGATFALAPHQGAVPLFFVARSEQAIYRVQFDDADAHRVARVDKFLDRRFGNVGGVATGPDGALYVFTANRAAGTTSPPASDDDRILRLTITEQAPDGK